MARRAIRRARELRESWVRALTGQVQQAPYQPNPVASNRGMSYEDAPGVWSCNRKKTYSSQDIAERVAARLNNANRDERTARPGFFGVTVNPYGCTRCGFWHLGR